MDRTTAASTCATASHRRRRRERLRRRRIGSLWHTSRASRPACRARARNDDAVTRRCVGPAAAVCCHRENPSKKPHVVQWHAVRPPRLWPPAHIYICIYLIDHLSTKLSDATSPRPHPPPALRHACARRDSRASRATRAARSSCAARCGAILFSFSSVPACPARM